MHVFNPCRLLLQSFGRTPDECGAMLILMSTPVVSQTSYSCMRKASVPVVQDKIVRSVGSESHLDICCSARPLVRPTLGSFDQVQHLRKGLRCRWTKFCNFCINKIPRPVLARGIFVHSTNATLINITKSKPTTQHLGDRAARRAETLSLLPATRHCISRLLI